LDFEIVIPAPYRALYAWEGSEGIKLGKCNAGVHGQPPVSCKNMFREETVMHSQMLASMCGRGWMHDGFKDLRS
jgi:hypothetical protein